MGFESHVGRTFEFIRKNKKNERNQPLRVPISVGKHNPMRVDEGRNSWNLLAMTIKARTVVGTGGDEPA